MSEKIIKSRIVHKHGLEAHWLLATNFIPKQGEIIVYDIEVDADGNALELPKDRTTPYTHQRLKIGDGITTVSELPFVVSEDEVDINMEKGTGEGAAQQLTDDEVFTIDSDYVDSKVQDKTGIKSIKTGAFGNYSTELGGKSQAKGKRSVAEGTSTIALGNYSHSEGNKTFAEGSASHAEGLQTEARGDDSHAEGHFSISTGSHSHAEGYNTHAKGNASHAEGNGTIASGEAQHVQGRWNIEDEQALDAAGYRRYAHIVGNGSDNSNRSNAHTIDWNGAGWFASDVRVGGTNYDDADKLATEDFVDSAKQEAIDESKAYTDKQLVPSSVTLYDAEQILENLQYSDTMGSVTTYIENEYVYIRDAGNYIDLKMGVKVSDGLIQLDYDANTTSLNAGFTGKFLVGELSAVAGRTYDFPTMLMESSEGETAKLYIADLDGSNIKAQGTYVQTGSIEDPTMSGTSYSTGYYNGFTFTATATKTYGIWIYVHTNDYYWKVIYSGDLVDLSSIVHSPVNIFATKEYVDSMIAEFGGTTVTTDGTALDTWDTNTKVDKYKNPYGVYITDANGNTTAASWTTGTQYSNCIPRCDNSGHQHVIEPTNDDHPANKKYVDDHALTDSHKTILDFLASKVGTPNLVFGTDANGQLTAMSINDLAAAIMQALPAAEEGEF